MNSVPIPVRFHLSLNVSSVGRAVLFFEKLLQTKVTKHRPDYAKFELDSPPLVLSLEERSPRESGSLNHLGFRFADSAALADVQRQLETIGIATQIEESVECCYARQSKFWVNDFDQRLWEFYVLEGDIDHRGAGQASQLKPLVDISTPATTAPLVQLGLASTESAPVVWEHLMGSPFNVPTAACSEIRLRGTFNVPMSAELIQEHLKKAFDALIPGGKIGLHILTAEAGLGESVTLTGPAAYVKFVPVRAELMRGLEKAGFQRIQLTTFRSGACFEFNGHALRETRIEAYRPLTETEPECQVLFKGPFQELTDDVGNHWRRGETSLISRERWSILKNSTESNMFVEIPVEHAVSHCGA